MRLLLLVACFAVVTECPATTARADPALDAPEGPPIAGAAPKPAASYADAVASWKTPEDVNAWIGARFAYDFERALALSETQRGRGSPLAIYDPAGFFAVPRGVCVDLARFAVETLRRIDPAISPRYLMIEFSPVTHAGNTLRRHWIASFERDGRHYFFADSKRPGLIAGPYASTQAFIDEYANYRGRVIVSHRAMDDYRRRERTMAAKQEASVQPHTRESVR